MRNERIIVVIGGATIPPQSIEMFNFPGGEVQVRLPEKAVSALRRNAKQRDDAKLDVGLVAILKNSDDIMAFLLIVNAIRSIDNKVKIRAIVPYLPYARQDRVCALGESNANLVFNRMLLHSGVNSFVFWDVHNADAIDYRLDAMSQILTKQQLLAEAANTCDLMAGVDVLIAPDRGAIDSVAKVAQAYEKEFVYAEKQRNPETGEIIGISMSAERMAKLKGKHCLVMDDICDGGRTFIELAKILEPVNHNGLELFVTHGIFSKGVDSLYDHYQQVWCMNNMSEDDEVIRRVAQLA